MKFAGFAEFVIGGRNLGILEANVSLLDYFNLMKLILKYIGRQPLSHKKRDVLMEVCFDCLKAFESLTVDGSDKNQIPF